MMTIYNVYDKDDKEVGAEEKRDVKEEEEKKEGDEQEKAEAKETTTIVGFESSARVPFRLQDKLAKRLVINPSIEGAPVAQWLASPPSDLQEPFCRGLEPHHGRPGLMEGLKA
ncbi:hypothetical protein PoB_006424900 [Plakobranchus ocellatus]|uniref:Uncharacterized protein n=1 Tax=Plakobranchus ocellatus TaxID=259542 RepID=A0AAV4D0Z0_9GAST|nr:hypothetical protein PoB_006424900 [Plakobranchus ocellatus]